MLTALRWLASVLSPRRKRPAYAYARRVLPVWAMLAVVGQGALLGVLSGSAQAQVPDNKLKEMGLDSVWRTQLQMPIEAGGIVSTHLWSNPDNRKVYAELTLPAGSGAGKRTFRMSADTIGDNGKPIGMEAAKHEVEIRAARALGRSAGVPAVEVSVPLIYLVVVTNDGLVQAFDAETGEHLWRNVCGPVTYPTAPAGVSDAGIVVAQGPTLYLLDWKTGKHLATRDMTRASTSGVAVVGTVAFVSSLSGQTGIFDFSKAERRETMSYRLFGRTITAPTSSGRAQNLVAFSTDKGIATVLSGGEKIGPWFNVRSKLQLSGPITFAGDALYLGDVTGQVSKVKLDRSGAVIWRFMLGEPLSAPPVVFNGRMFATNEVGELNCIDDETGFPVWNKPTERVKAILAGTKDYVYCRSLTDRLLVIEVKSGKVLSETGSAVIGNDLINQLNDRLYVISAGGVLQCARQSGSDYVMPVFHVPQPAAKAPEKPKAGVTEDPAMDAAPAVDADPFGAGMGADAAPAGDATDPFAVPATPPAAGGMSDNPF